MLILQAEVITSVVPFIHYFADVITFNVSLSIKKKLLHPKKKRIVLMYVKDIFSLIT